jgi:chromosome segregation ATPase
VNEEAAYWKQKAKEYHQLQQETQQQFEEFQADSRDLEHELEQQLEGLEAKLKDSTLKLERVSSENSDLKEKLTKAKDLARQEVITLEGKVSQLSENEKKLKAKIRELEQTTDDFERFERYPFLLFFFSFFFLADCQVVA